MQAKYINNKKIINCPPLPIHNEPDKHLNPAHDRRTKTIIDTKNILTGSQAGTFLVASSKNEYYRMQRQDIT